MPRTKRYPIKLTVRVDPAEGADIAAQASRRGLSISRHLAEQGRLPGPGWSADQRRAYERAMVQFRRAGNTLDLVARVLTAGRGVADGRLRATLADLAAAAQAVERVFER